MLPPYNLISLIALFLNVPVTNAFPIYIILQFLLILRFDFPQFAFRFIEILLLTSGAVTDLLA